MAQAKDPSLSMRDFINEIFFNDAGNVVESAPQR